MRPVSIYVLRFNSLRAVSTSVFDQSRILILPTLTNGGAVMRFCRMARCRFGWWIPSIFATSVVEYFRMLIWTYITFGKCVKQKAQPRQK
jgi:hypothetical protein